MNSLTDRFFRYVAIDTQSNETSNSRPSTNKQLKLANLLKTELKELGLEDVTQDEKGYIMATLPANTRGSIPVIGFIAHMDTSPDMSGKDVQPLIIKNYDGKDIELNKKVKIVLSF